MDDNNLLYYDGDNELPYTGLIYREVAKEVLAGLNQLVKRGNMSVCYEKAFRQGAEICQSILVAEMYTDQLFLPTLPELDEAIAVTTYLKEIALKNRELVQYSHQLKDIRIIKKTLLLLADERAVPENCPAEHLQSIYDLFLLMWLVLNKELEELGILTKACSFITQASKMRQ